MFENLAFVMVENAFGGEGEANTLDVFTGFKGLIEMNADLKINKKVRELREGGATQIWVGYKAVEDSGLYCIIYYRSDGNMRKEPDKQIECYLGNEQYFTEAYKQYFNEELNV